MFFIVKKLTFKFKFKLNYIKKCKTRQDIE